MWPGGRRQRIEQQRAEAEAEAKRRAERLEEQTAREEEAKKSRLHQWIIGGLSLVVGVAAIVVTLIPDGGNDATSKTPIVGTPEPLAPPPTGDAVAASAAAPPLLIESVTRIESQSGDGTVVSATPLAMRPEELARFNERVVLDTAEWNAWERANGMIPVDFGVLRVTVRGNTNARVGITDIGLKRSCRQPWAGTYVGGYSQGTGDTLRLGFDLDAPRPIAQTLATTGHGLTPTGDSFFAEQTVTLAHGETETLAIGAFTKRHACEFTLRIYVSTPEGLVWQDVDDDGRPFRVTAKAAPRSNARPLSGYARAYVVQGVDGNRPVWSAVDPATYAGDS